MTSPIPPTLTVPPRRVGPAAATAQPDPYTAELEAGLSPVEEALIVVLAVYFASTAAVAAVTLPAALVADLAALGLPRRAITTAGRLVMAEPVTGRGRYGSPTRTLDRHGSPVMARMVAANEPTMRARYLLAATKRLARGTGRGGFTRTLARERTYLAAHRRAGVRRARIAREYDQTARRTEWLEWRTRRDARVTSDCAAREGEVWHRSRPVFPPPGAQHPYCRCRAVPARPR